MNKRSFFFLSPHCFFKTDLLFIFKAVGGVQQVRVQLSRLRWEGIRSARKLSQKVIGDSLSLWAAEGTKSHWKEQERPGHPLARAPERFLPTGCTSSHCPARTLRLATELPSPTRLYSKVGPVPAGGGSWRWPRPENPWQNGAWQKSCRP